MRVLVTMPIGGEGSVRFFRREYEAESLEEVRALLEHDLALEGYRRQGAMFLEVDEEEAA